MGMQKFMASLEAPPVSARTLKRSEREIAVTEKVPKNSCLDTTQLGQNLCSLNSSEANKEVVVDLKASYGMGWQQKVSVRAYNNRRGHGVLRGTEIEKILSYGTRISNCKQCEVNKVTGRVKEHGCNMNWGGSSRAVESDLAVDILVSGTTETARTSTVIMDED